MAEHKDWELGMHLPTEVRKERRDLCAATDSGRRASGREAASLSTETGRTAEPYSAPYSRG